MRPMRRRESRLPLCIVYRLSDRVSSALVESGLVARAFAPRPGRASRVPSRLLGFEHDRMGVASQRAVGRRCGSAYPPPWTRRSHRTHTQRRSRGPLASVPEGHPPVESDASGGTRRFGSGLSLPGGVRLDAVPSRLGVSAAGGHALPWSRGDRRGVGGTCGLGGRMVASASRINPDRNGGFRAPTGTSVDGPRTGGGRDSGSGPRSVPTAAGPGARTTPAVAGTAGAATPAGTRTRAGGSTRGRSEIDGVRGDEERHRGREGGPGSKGPLGGRGAPYERDLLGRTRTGPRIEGARGGGPIQGGHGPAGRPRKGCSPPGRPAFSRSGPWDVRGPGRRNRIRLSRHGFPRVRGREGAHAMSGSDGRPRPCDSVRARPRRGRRGAGGDPLAGTGPRLPGGR